MNAASSNSKDGKRRYVARFAGEAFAHQQKKETAPLLRRLTSELAYRKPPVMNVPQQQSY